MIGRRLCLSISAALLTGAVALTPLSAEAGYMYDLTVGGNWTGSGSITLDTLSGSASSGVSAFTFSTATGVGSPQDYGLADISHVSWSIDGSNNLSLFLITSLVPFSTISSAVLLTTDQSSFNFDPCTGNTGSTGSVSCTTSGGGQVTSNFGGTLTADLNPITTASEPAELAIFGFGLAGLGYVRRRKRAA